jgi:hypothetical protein
MGRLQSFDDYDDALREYAAKPAAQRPPISFSCPLLAPSLVRPIWQHCDTRPRALSSSPLIAIFCLQLRQLNSPDDYAAAHGSSKLFY